METKKIYTLAQNMRKEAIEMAYRAGSRGAHLGAGLSAIEIIACLYGAVMEYDLNKKNSNNQDVFIPSKAHCVLAYYTALAYNGFFPKEELELFEDDLTPLPGHPIMNFERGIQFSGGSLGMGLSQGVGLALGMKRKGINKNVYVLLGDGECQEGAVWEAFLSAVQFKLDNLIVIVDKNELQYDGKTTDIMGINNMQACMENLGFMVYQIDGHNIEELLTVLMESKIKKHMQPYMIIANTVKGKGISFMEGNKLYHHAVLNEKEYKQAMNELDNI